MFYGRTVCLYLFLFYLILMLNVGDNSGNVYANVTLVMNTHAAFHKTL